ncbi:MAG: VCBS repeat-containing protein [Chitinophagaceae bacterium]
MIPVRKCNGILIVPVLLLIACNSIHFNPFVSKEVKQGYKLAKVYCSSCHQFPEPDLLDKSTWALYVLPRMGGLLGFRQLETGGYIEGGKERIKLDQWKQIVRYYTSQAPEEPLRGKKNKIRTALKHFSINIPSFTIQRPATTLVKIDSGKQRIYFGDGLTGQLYALSNDYRLTDSFEVNPGISGLHIGGRNMMALSMGVLHPSDEKKGKLAVIDTGKTRMHNLLDSLQRPVHALHVDLTNDGREDIIVAEFGNQTGMLSWFENIPEDRYAKHILRAQPGAVRSQVNDFNKDGRPDIIALMAQGDEGLFIYYNLGNGNFREERILQFPPSYGSNYFELADVNHDGFADIIATNGDNGDYPPILKAYHGIRIYLNDGHNQFRQEVFLPVNGAGKAIAKDFDGDGDIDLASIAYFADYDHYPEEGFIYWENTGRLSFEPSSFEKVSMGRWLTMDAGDIDGDGDLDIILGNTNFSLGYVPEQLKKKWDRYAPSVVILVNNLYR